MNLAELVKVESFLIADEAGFPVEESMQIRMVERTPSQIQFEAETFGFDERYGFITENSRPSYGASSPAQIALGTYIAAGPDAPFPDGATPYLMF